jgi:hypothetical protein
VVDGLVDVEKEESGVIALQEITLGEVEDAAAVDEREQLHPVVHLRFLNAGEQLRVARHRVHFVLDVFALEEFLSGA